MSLTKRFLEAQQKVEAKQAERLALIARQPALNVLDCTGAIIVNRHQLIQAYRDAMNAARHLDAIESPMQIDVNDIDYLHRTMSHVTELLGQMLGN